MAMLTSILDSDLYDYRFDQLDSHDHSNEHAGLDLELTVNEIRYNSSGKQVVLRVDPEDDFDPRDKDVDFDSAIVFNRLYFFNKSLSHTELKIRSQYMRQALEQVIVDYPGITLNSHVVSITDSPRCLFHYRHELEAYARTLQDPVAVRHIIFLLRYMQQVFRLPLKTYREYVEAEPSNPSLDWVNLWMAFRPGDLIWHRHFNGTDLVSRLVQMDRCECTDPKCQRNFWKVKVASIDYDGEKCGYTTTVLHIHSYNGFKSLDKLFTFPLRYHSKREAIRSKLLKRGRKFLSLRGSHQRQYSGSAEAVSESRRQTNEGEQDVFPYQTTAVNAPYRMPWESNAN
ncbi:MAG: hypothetical protein Q9160_000181 [Pyrenula sp. 1 TL-2023]